MSMLERDLEELEQYLDNGLEPAAVAHLEKRVASETELAAALVELRAQRAVRSAVWQSMEPDTAASERMVWRVRGAMLDRQRSAAVEARNRLNPWRVASFSSAAAACLLFGFTFGRVIHPNVAAPNTAASTAGQAAIASGNGASSNLVEYKPGDRSVPITNDHGDVVAWQTFDSPEQAKSFYEDLHRAHTAPPVSGNIRTVDQEQPVPF